MRYPAVLLLALLPLQSFGLPAAAPPKTAPATPGARDTVSHEAQLRARAAEVGRQLGPAFHVRYQWPFVVAGNDDEADFDRSFQYSLIAPYNCLVRDYFSSRPAQLLTVYLFKNDADYRGYAKKLFGDNPDTPYGYYSRVHRALIMNIETGGGTLVHELCHPLIESDFPSCPTWFNEGLASLHEQCTERGGSLVGLPNWRLAGLQKAITSGTALSLKDLMAKADAVSFYNQDKGLNYAVARYLCQYVQERGKLKEYYASLKRNIATDPNGQKTLETLLGSSIDKIDADWRRWVMTLRFP